MAMTDTADTGAREEGCLGCANTTSATGCIEHTGPMMLVGTVEHRLRVLHEFYLAIHALWDAQRAVGQAHTNRLPAIRRAPLDRALRDTMRRLVASDEAVKNALWRIHASDNQSV